MERGLEERFMIFMAETAQDSTSNVRFSFGLRHLMDAGAIGVTPLGFVVRLFPLLRHHQVSEEI